MALLAAIGLRTFAVLCCLLLVLGVLFLSTYVSSLSPYQLILLVVLWPVWCVAIIIFLLLSFNVTNQWLLVLLPAIVGAGLLFFRVNLIPDTGSTSLEAYFLTTLALLVFVAGFFLSIRWIRSAGW